MIEGRTRSCTDPRKSLIREESSRSSRVSGGQAIQTVSYNRSCFGTQATIVARFSSTESPACTA